MEIDFARFGLKTEVEQDPPFSYIRLYKHDREWGPLIRIPTNSKFKVVTGKIVGNPIEVLERFTGFVNFATMRAKPYCFLDKVCEYGKVIVFNPQLLRPGAVVKIVALEGRYRTPACGGIHCEERALVLVVEEAAITDNKNEIEFTITRCEEQEGVVAAISHVLHYYNRYSENPHMCRQLNIIYKKSSQ